MGAGHGATGGLHHDGDSRVHRLPPEAKLAATVLFVLAVVATPREAVWAFAVDAALLGVLVVVARLPARLVLRRLRIEVPVLAFAVLLPVVGDPPRVDVLGASLSEPGLWAAWNVVAKGTLGVLAAIVLSATTPVTDLLAGLDRLKVPRVLTAIAGAMVRSLDLVVGDAERMRIARLSRGDDPRWLWQARATAATAGVLFVRSYERGERVHLAMAARGFDGTMPPLRRRARRAGDLVAAALLPVAAGVVTVLAHLAT